MYDKNFAKVYNEDWSWFSVEFAKTLNNKFKLAGKILDLGCGTGNMLKEIENCFEQSVGVDNSRSMLALAKKNCKKSEFVACDVLNFNFANKFNYITCTFDMINHLQTLQDWKLMFENVVKHLEDNGVFVFDYNTSFKFKDITQEESSHDDDRHIIRFKNTKLDDNHVECKIKVFNKENREKIAEITQIESFFETKDIKKALKEAGFKTIKIVDKDLQPCKAEQEKRIFVICKK